MPFFNSVRKPKGNLVKWLWGIIASILIVSGSGVIYFITLPYGSARPIADRLSPNHHLESFTQDVFKFIQPIGWAAGGLCLAMAVYLLLFPSHSKCILVRILRWFEKEVKRFPADMAQLWEDYRPHASGWPYLIIILLIIVAGVFARLLFLGYPMQYDESYTVVVFAQRPWRNLISDYSLPNNHIFYSILVKLSINLFGSEPWAVRLPAFLSGILTIPAGYILARQLYGRKTALLGAGLIAVFPIMVSYNTNSRGYSLYMLCSLVIFSLVPYLIKHNNLAAWILTIITTVVGFYTVPFMLYPFGAACLWYIISALKGETHLAYGSFWGALKYLLAAGMIVVLLTVLLYSPVIFIGSGWNSLINNPFVKPLSWGEFWIDTWMNLGNSFNNMYLDIPFVFQIILGMGVFLSLIFHFKDAKVKIPLQIVSAVWSLMVMIVMRRFMDRVFLFFVPLWLIWACAGLLAPFAYLKQPWKKLEFLTVFVGLALMGFWSHQWVHYYFPGWQNDPGKVEIVSNYLSENLEEGDAVAVVFPNDAPYWYYLGQMGVADEFMHRIDTKTHQRVFVVVNRLYSETAASNLEAQGLDPDEYRAADADLIYEFHDQEIYLCRHE